MGNLDSLIFGIRNFFSNLFGGSAGYSPFWSGVGRFFGETLSVVWVLVIIAFIVLFAVIIHTWMSIHELKEANKKKYNEHFIKPIPKAVQPKNERWEYVMKLFSSQNQNDWRIAIIEADTMLDELLTSLGFVGDNLGERLKNANIMTFPPIQSAWEAHKVRNRIAHDGANYPLSAHEANTTRKHFEFVFREMRVI
jgi:hypothetical protein